MKKRGNAAKHLPERQNKYIILKCISRFPQAVCNII